MQFHPVPRITGWTAGCLLFVMALPAAPPADADAPATAQIEVRAHRKTGDFRVRQGGRELAIREVRWVPPVEQWKDSPDATEPTRIYIATEVGQTELWRVLPGIECFLRQPMSPDVLVSVGGLPFTDDTGSLREMLRAIPLATELTGRGWAGVLPEGVDPRMFRSDHHQSRAFALFRYADLVQKLSRYPGKKIVVLFHAGFDVGPETTPFLERLAMRAFRNRITFHSASMRDTDRAVPETRMGLAQIARMTGGKFRWDPSRRLSERPVLDVNPCSANAFANEALHDALESAGGYHLITFMPDDPSAGEFQEVEVTVGEPGEPVAVLPPRFRSAQAGPRSPLPDIGFGAMYDMLEAENAEPAPVKVL